MSVKIYKKNNYCVVDNGLRKEYFAGDEMSIANYSGGGWVIWNSSSQTESFTFSYTAVQNEVGVSVGSESDVEEYLTLVTNFKKSDDIYSALDFSSLEDGKVVGQLAYVINSQGTAWLPSTLGGSYYPKGWYVWNGTNWISDRNSTASELYTIKNDISVLQTIGGGTNISFFQVQDDGVTGQLTTTAFVTVGGMWATPTLTGADYTFSAATGQLQINKAGTIEFDCKLASYQTLNNRHELYIELQKNGVTLVSDAQYASRSSAQRVGGSYIMGYKDSCTSGDIYRLRTKHTGVAATIGVTSAANMSYFSAKLYI